MLANGIFSNIGDTFVIQLDPIVKVVSFDSFQDGVQGEDVNKYFFKEFRYSDDGKATWNPWTTLTDGNLQSITAVLGDTYYFEVRYTRAGTDATGDLIWDYVNINLTQNLLFDSSVCGIWFDTPNIFCDIAVDDPVLVELCGNLADKLYKYGILPKYISDKTTEERTDDYKHFWHIVACYLALHYVFATRFADIYNRQDMLILFLRQRGIFLCGDETLLELQTIASNYYDQVRKRGTAQVVGELRRVICAEDADELIFAVVRAMEGGWVVDRSSPLYTGLQGVRSINKMPEKDGDVVDKANYHLINGADMDIITDADNDGDPIDVFHLDSVSATTGLYQTGGNNSLKMVVSPTLNYEISFFVKQEVLGDILSFGVKAWDADGNEIANPFEDIVTGGDDQYFFRTAGVIKQTGKYVQVRGIIYNKDEANKTATEGLLNIGFGKCLRFKSNVAFIYPIIVVENGVSVPGNSTKMYGFRTGLCSLDYSLCFLELAGFIINFMTIHNTQLTTDEIDDIINRYLIPLNTTIETTLL